MQRCSSPISATWPPGSTVSASVAAGGLLDWRYRGRLVARQLDRSHIVIRASFDSRGFLLRSFPDTFSVPNRFAKHMMIVADIENGNAEAIEDAVIGAWELQSGK